MQKKYACVLKELLLFSALLSMESEVVNLTKVKDVLSWRSGQK